MVVKNCPNKQYETTKRNFSDEKDAEMNCEEFELKCIIKQVFLNDMLFFKCVCK